MSEQKLEGYFFTALFISVLVLVGVLFFPFIGALALALVLAILVDPINKALVKRTGSPTLSTLATVMVVTLAVLLPAIGVTALLVDEVMGIAQYFSTYDVRQVPGILSDLTANLREVFPIVATIDFGGFLQSLTQYAGTVAAGIFTGTLSIIFGFVIVIIALFFFLRDGHEFVKELISMSPLSDDEDVQIVRKLSQVTHSLIRGTLVVALLQGLLVGTGFLIFGIPNPVLWGSVAAIGALIPNIGTGIISIPAIVYLLLSGNIPQAVGLLGWSVFIVGLVDNIIGPRLIGRGARIHPLFVLLSVLGGLSMFGLAGFLLGPLTFGLLVALAEIYKVKVRQIHDQS